MVLAVDKKQHYKTINKTCYVANTVYLFIHVFYLVLFLIAKLYIMVAVDAAVIAIYLAFFLVLKKQKYYLYALLCGNEFFVFVSVATVMLGFDTGFHFYLIGLCVVSFFTSYFSKISSATKSLIWVGLSAVIYLALYFVTRYNAPYYAIDPWLEITLFVTHAILVFGFIASYMVVFLRYALSLENQIMNDSRTDELTQINNRYALYDYVATIKDKTSKALALFDIDDFKNVNDIYGHAAGDYVLKRIAEIASQSLEDAFVCRYGGEEFVLVLNVDGKTSYYDQLENLRMSVEREPFEVNGEPLKITITVGVAICPSKDLALERWISLADEKMYAGKSTGKNRVVV